MCALSVGILVTMLRIIGVAVVVDLNAKPLNVEKLNEVVVLNTIIGSIHFKLDKMLRSLLMWLWVCCGSLTFIICFT